MLGNIASAAGALGSLFGGGSNSSRAYGGSAGVTVTNHNTLGAVPTAQPAALQSESGGSDPPPGFLDGMRGMLESVWGKVFGGDDSVWDRTWKRGSDMAIQKALNELFGVPDSPHEFNRAEMARMNHLFPGTNPWERLGGNPGSGSVLGEAANLSLEREKISRDERLKLLELETKQVINHRQVLGQVIAAGAPLGREGIMSAVQAFLDGEPTNFNVPADRLRSELNYMDAGARMRDSQSRKFDSEANLMDKQAATEGERKVKVVAEAVTAGVEATVAKAKEMFAKDLAEAGVRKEQQGNVFQAIGTMVESVTSGKMKASEIAPGIMSILAAVGVGWAAGAGKGLSMYGKKIIDALRGSRGKKTSVGSPPAQSQPRGPEKQLDIFYHGQ